MLAQEISFSKDFPFDSSSSLTMIPQKMILSADNNLYIAGSYQRSINDGSSNIFAMKTTLNGDIIWSKTFQWPRVACLNDCFERDGKITLTSLIETKIGKYDYSVLQVNTLSKDGDSLYQYIDTTKQTLPYIFGEIVEYNQEIVSIASRTTSYPILGILRFELDGKFKTKIEIDSLDYPNFLSIGNQNTCVLNDGTIGFSFGSLNKDNTAPIRYLVFDSSFKKIREFETNTSGNNLNASTAGHLYKTKSGFYILTGYAQNYTNGYNSVVRMVDSTGKLMWEDTLKGETYFTESIIEDINNNIILVGSKFNKKEEGGSTLLNYNYLGCYSHQGKRLFHYTWGDSTIYQHLNSVCVDGNNNVIVSGGNKKNIYFARISNTTGLEDNLLKENLSLSVYPNPAEDYIEISNPSALESEATVDLYVFNAYGGRVIGLKASSNGKIKIVVSGLLPGVYFVRVGEKVCRFLKI
jgi:hypothetical protein